MKNRFVKLTLMLCVIMMMAAPASSFAASSCGNSKAANRSCANYMSLFTKSNAIGQNILSSVIPQIIIISPLMDLCHGTLTCFSHPGK